MADHCRHCPVRPGLNCLGTIAPSACVRQATDDAFRRSLVRRAEVLAAWPRVRSCPHRGPVLPVSRQLDCGCVGTELNGCRAGKGLPHMPDATTIDRCTACVGP